MNSSYRKRSPFFVILLFICNDLSLPHSIMEIQEASFVPLDLSIMKGIKGLLRWSKSEADCKKIFGKTRV